KLHSVAAPSVYTVNAPNVGQAPLSGAVIPSYLTTHPRIFLTTQVLHFLTNSPLKGLNPLLRVRGQRGVFSMTAYRVHQVRGRLAELEQQIARAEQDGKNLCQAFRQRFPRSPFYLVRYPNRTMTLYRWRRSSHRHWRGQDIPAGLNHPVNLASEGGVLLLQLLPESARPHYLNFERQRLDLNLTLSLRH